MKIVLDTNVFVSAVFFGGPPGAILEVWLDGRVDLAISPDILDEYVRVANELAVQFPEVDLLPILERVAQAAELVAAPPLKSQVCVDADDDKFLA